MKTIPCTRPEVTIDPRDTGLGAVDANCHVPGCSWTYPADKQYMALKSDATFQATMHRQDHRASVPSHRVTSDGGPGFTSDCECGWRWGLRGTRTDAQQVLDYHLTKVHGLVVCS